MFEMKAESVMRIAFVLFMIKESAFGSAPSDSEDGSFRLTILHNNDMHARFEQTGVMSDKCSKSDADGNRCYGGFARVAYKVREFRERARLGKAPPVLYMNAGDTYTGTPWFIVHKDKIASDFLRMLKPDAISLGNHEFDEGTENLAQFLKSVDFPVLVANLNLENHPNLKSDSLKSSTTFDIDDRKVGVIGYLTPETTNFVVSETVTFFDEIEMINKEAARLKTEGINIIIALGHSGLEKDKRIAAQCPEVDLIIGGHSHTFLFTGKAPSIESPEDKYPVVVTQAVSGKRVPVVQAYAFTKYLGHLELTFDVGGNLIEIDGAPILLDASVPRSHDVLELLDKYRPGVLEFVNGYVGTTKVVLDGACRRNECNLGNFITDAMVDFVTTSNRSEGLGTEAAIAFIAGGNIRASINHASNQGQITKEDLSAVLPFGKKLEIVEVSGKALLEALEHSVRHYTLGEARGEFPQVSGIHVKFDMSRPSGARATKVKVRCAECSSPTYRELENTKSYKIVTFDFLARGGDGFVMFTSSTTRKTNDTGFDAVSRYLEKMSPINPVAEGRIEIEYSVETQPPFVPFKN